MQNRTTIPTTGELVVTTCWCGIQFAMPSALMQWHRERTDNATYCPIGHAGVIRQTTAQKLQAAEARQRHLEDQLHAAEAAAESTRRQLVRDRHRFANGVCPCCNRSFPDVARHMASKHPEYDPTDLSVKKLTYKCSCGRTFTTPAGLRTHQGHQRRDNWQDPSEPKWRRHLTIVDP